MFKKSKRSFTLVELSIVLLVLSILVGVLLTGRKIVDRANLQKVIFEIDYYKKALILYRDTYNVYPGNMDEDTCTKYSEFSQLDTEDDSGNIDMDKVAQYCKSDRSGDSKGRTNDGYSGSSLMATNERWVSFLNAMRFMQTSGIIEGVQTTIADDELANGGNYTDSDKGPWDENCKDCISYNNVKRTQAKTSFDSNGAVTLAGILFDSTKTNSYNLNFIRGSNNSDNETNGHEFYDSEVRKIVNSKNVIILYKNTPAAADDQYGSGSLATGILTADIANQLDVKLDDGRPGSGNIIGLKNGYVKTSGLSDNDKKKVCYNALQNEVSTAYYVANTDVKNGCNILYVFK